MKNGEKSSLEKTPEVSLKNSTLGEQDKSKGASFATTGLTGPTRHSENKSKSMNKARPSFEELLAKYKKKGGTQETAE
jgi:hypothetical protein